VDSAPQAPGTLVQGCWQKYLTEVLDGYLVPEEIETHRRTYYMAMITAVRILLERLTAVAAAGPPEGVVDRMGDALAPVIEEIVQFQAGIRAGLREAVLDAADPNRKDGQT
jgi:hypothetical protein